MPIYLVYGLFTFSPDGEKQYFYVGKTRRQLNVRLREHVYQSKNAHQDLYAHIREIEKDGIAWYEEILHRAANAEYAPDIERFEVIRLLRLGHNLCNMRYGDASHKAEFIRQQADLTIRNADDVTRQRKQAERKKELRKQGCLRRKALIELLKENGIESVQDCKLLKQATIRRLVICGCKGIGRGCTLRQLIGHAREYRRWGELERYKNSVLASVYVG